MRANRITFDKLKAQWDILKMRSAYIDAERIIVEEASKGNDLTGFDSQVITFTSESTGPIEFFNEMSKPLSIAEEILEKAREVREKLDNAIHADDYVKAQMYQNILNGLEEKYNKYKDE